MQVECGHMVKKKNDIVLLSKDGDKKYYVMSSGILSKSCQLTLASCTVPYYL